MFLITKRILLNSFFVIILFFVAHNTSFGQEKIKWMTWNEAVEAQKTDPRKVVVDLYTSWCGWCKKMDKTTFVDPQVVAYINTHFHAVKFNGEQKQKIIFKGQEYEYVNAGRRGYHMLAAELTKGKLSYPTFAFLDENLNLIQPISSYFGPIDFGMILHYFGDDYYKNTPWKRFSEDYKQQNKNKSPQQGSPNTTLVKSRQ